MGGALKRLRIPVGEVWSSPTYRAIETARLAQLPTPKTAAELGDGGQSMQVVASDQGAWLRVHATAPPKAGTDTVIISYLPNLRAAFGQTAAGLGDGEGLLFRPAAPTPDRPVARIKIEDWPELSL